MTLTLTLTLEALWSRNVFVFKEYMMLHVKATKYNDNITPNCEQITLNMKNDMFWANFVFVWPWP